MGKQKKAHVRYDETAPGLGRAVTIDGATFRRGVVSVVDPSFADLLVGRFGFKLVVNKEKTEDEHE